MASARSTERLGKPEPGRRGASRRQPLRAPRGPHPLRGGRRGGRRPLPRRSVAVAPSLHHRHMGWEVPPARRGGRVAEVAGRREVLEETGWRPGPLRHLVTYNPMNGLADKRFHLFVAEGSHPVGEPTEVNEPSVSSGAARGAASARAQRARCADGSRSRPCCTRCASSTESSSTEPFSPRRRGRRSAS